MAVAQLYFHLAPKAEIGVIAKALVRLLRSHRWGLFGIPKKLCSNSRQISWRNQTGHPKWTRHGEKLTKGGDRWTKAQADEFNLLSFKARKEIKREAAWRRRYMREQGGWQRWGVWRLQIYPTVTFIERALGCGAGCAVMLSSFSSSLWFITEPLKCGVFFLLNEFCVVLTKYMFTTFTKKKKNILQITADSSLQRCEWIKWVFTWTLLAVFCHVVRITKPRLQQRNPAW